MAKKDYTAQMAKAMGMTLPQQNQEQEEQPKPKRGRQAKQKVETAAPTPEPTPTPTESEQPMMVAAGVRKSTQGRKSGNKPQRTQHTPSVKVGLQDGYTRATIIVKAEYIDKMKEIAYRDRSTLKDIVEQALANYIDTYEDENGGIAL